MKRTVFGKLDVGDYFCFPKGDYFANHGKLYIKSGSGQG